MPPTRGASARRVLLSYLQLPIENSSVERSATLLGAAVDPWSESAAKHLPVPQPKSMSLEHPAPRSLRFGCTSSRSVFLPGGLGVLLAAGEEVVVRCW